MRATGFVRRIDDLGRVVIPKEVRKAMHLREGDPLEVFINEDEVTFKKYQYSTAKDLEGYADIIRDQLQDQGASYEVQKEALSHLNQLIRMLRKDYRD